MSYRSFEELLKRAGHLKAPVTMAVPAADEHSVEAAVMAATEGIVKPLFIGDPVEIRIALARLAAYVPEDSIVEEKDPARAAELAVAMVREGRAGFILKGRMDTKVILKAVVDKEKGLGTGRTMSHFVMIEAPGYHKLIIPVDGGMVPYPTLEQKKDIIDNTVSTLLALGYDCPKVGVLACVEKLNPKMPETVDGDLLKQMNQEGEIKNCIVEGPISLDCAVSKEIADFKGFESPCAGDCDVFLAPNIHAGNIMGKLLTTLAGGKMAGFIVGAACPIAMTSRGSSPEEKYYSIAIAALAAAGV